MSLFFANRKKKSYRNNPFVGTAAYLSIVDGQIEAYQKKAARSLYLRFLEIQKLKLERAILQDQAEFIRSSTWKDGLTLAEYSMLFKVLGKVGMAFLLRGPSKECYLLALGTTIKARYDDFQKNMEARGFAVLDGELVQLTEENRPQVLSAFKAQLGQWTEMHKTFSLSGLDTLTYRQDIATRIAQLTGCELVLKDQKDAEAMDVADFVSIKREHMRTLKRQVSAESLAFQDACEEGEYWRVKKAIKKQPKQWRSAFINTRLLQTMALHKVLSHKAFRRSYFSKYYRIARLLISYGADPDARNAKGKSARECAKENGRKLSPKFFRKKRFSRLWLDIFGLLHKRPNRSRIVSVSAQTQRPS
jgi:hypothetical protein